MSRAGSRSPATSPSLEVDDLREPVEAALAGVVRQLPPTLEPFADAIGYSLLAPGKRIRPVLLLAAAEAVGAQPAPLADVAAAVECIHAYSLVHDDLPAMDDDDLRRGLPTSHRAYGEAVAILVGDALQAEAFRLVAEAQHPASPARRLAITAVLARAAGPAGMVGGQYLDVAGDVRTDLPARVRELHDRKTGALIAASVETGSIAGGASERERELLRTYGEGLGWLFQLVDDLLDVVGDEAVTGKPSGTDERHGKVTALEAYGGEPGLRAEVDAQLERCLEPLRELPGGGGRLVALARFVHARDH